jgi:DNA-binding ferritin-like protein
MSKQLPFPPKKKMIACPPTTNSQLLALQYLLAALRGAHWSHWSSHWQVSGHPYYGDHLLMQRIYEAIPAEIDNLAEKIVAYYGPDAVAPLCQAAMMYQFLKFQEENDPIVRALNVERFLLEYFDSVFKELDSQDKLSLGLNDYLAAAANVHETFVYLLQQRTRS